MNEEQQTKQQSAPSVDESQLKLVSAIGYLGILFLIPYLLHPKNEFAVFHANQSLILFIGAIVINIVGGLIPFIGWFIIVPLGNLCVLGLAIMGIINVVHGEKKRLPFIGNFELLKVQQ